MVNEDAKSRPFMKDPEVQAALRPLLEEAPLYRRVEVRVRAWDPGEAFPISITRRCERCKDHITTTWYRGTLFKKDGFAITQNIAFGLVLAYRCTLCGESTVSFWFGIDEKYEPLLALATNASTVCVSKIGQWPPWSIAPSKAVEAALGIGSAQLDFYKAGLVCISQSYGLGALAYFRRVVEDTVDMLLDLVRDAAESDGDAATLARVTEARKQTVADEKLRLASAIVPASLRPGNINPLKRLYEDFSEGIHALTETECLDRALAIQRTFDFILENLRERVEDAKRYRDEINKLGRKK